MNLGANTTTKGCHEPPPARRRVSPNCRPGALTGRFALLPKPNRLASLSPGSLPRSHPGFIVPQSNPPLLHSEWRGGPGRGGAFIQFSPPLGFGRWTLDFGRWTLDFGRWTLDFGRWTFGFSPAPCREATPDISQPRCGWNRPNKMNPSCRDAGKRTTATTPACRTDHPAA